MKGSTKKEKLFPEEISGSHVQTGNTLFVCSLYYQLRDEMLRVMGSSGQGMSQAELPSGKGPGGAR